MSLSTYLHISCLGSVQHLAKLKFLFPLSDKDAELRVLSKLPKAPQLRNSTGILDSGLSMSYKGYHRAWDKSANITWDGLRKMLYWRKDQGSVKVKDKESPERNVGKVLL